MKSLMESFLLVAGMLLLGSFNTMVLKLMFQTECLTEDGQQRRFDKPWLSNCGVFAGEASLLLVFLLQNRYSGRPSSRAKIQTASRSASKRSSRTKRQTVPSRVPSCIFAVPACCDVMGTGIAAVGMTLIDAAAWQMMRGSIVIFTAVLTVCFLRRRLQMHHWLGVVITSTGLLCIGIATVLEADSRYDMQGDVKGGAFLGIVLVMLGQVFNAFQCVFEEHLLTGCEVSSLQTVGMEGVWGSALMAVVLGIMSIVKGSDHGVYESLPDGLYMIRSSWMLQILMLTNLLLVTNYNLLGMRVCRKMSAVTKCLVDCMRTVVVWALQLAVYYGISPRYGHPWTDYSCLQVFGFLLLTFGTLVYNTIVELPGLDYSQIQIDMSDVPDKSFIPMKGIQAFHTPTMIRASLWGCGAKLGPRSPQSPDGATSPLAAPFGFSAIGESSCHGEAYIFMEEEVQ